MIDKICKFLTNKMREEMPDIDDERAEIINYGLKNIIGEIPKIFIMLGIAYALGVLKLALETFLIILPYRTFSGGFHLKTHIGCIVCTSLMYIGPAYLAQYIEITGIVKICCNTLEAGIIKCLNKGYMPISISLLSKNIANLRV